MANSMQTLACEYATFIIILYIGVRCIFQRNNKMIKFFSGFIGALALFSLVNIHVRLVETGTVAGSRQLLFGLNAAFMISQTFVTYAWFVFFENIQETFISKNTVAKIIGVVPLAVMVWLCIASYRTGWLFYIDSEVIYHRGSVFFLQVLIPYIYVVASIISAIVYSIRNKERRTMTIILLALIPAVINTVFQLIFGGSFIIVGLTFSALAVYIELCMEELKKIEELQALAEVNKKLEQANMEQERQLTEIQSLNTELTDSQEQLEQALDMANEANRAKTVFLNNMSHDIRTPMNAIVGFTHLAESHIEDTKQVENYLGKIATSSELLLSLINDVLDMSRIESGKIQIEETVVHLPDIIRDLITIIQPEADEKKLELQIHITDLVQKDVLCDPLRLNQVLINIVGNAIKYTEPGGRISIELKQKETTRTGYADYEFRVGDTGIGMSQEFLGHIFEAFTREESQTVQNIQGTGLGMSIAKHIVDLMGGAIEVESTLGKGTDFTVGLSLKIAESERSAENPDMQVAASEETGIEEQSMFHGKRILLAEDNKLNQEIAVTVLQEAGFDVEVADDGVIAVEKLRQAEAGYYDVILMDIQMPNMNGYQAARTIRSLDHPLAGIPIFAMTANAFAEDKEQAKAAGMNGHIAKPIDIKILMNTLKKVLC